MYEIMVKILLKKAISKDFTLIFCQTAEFLPGEDAHSCKIFTSVILFKLEYIDCNIKCKCSNKYLVNGCKSTE